MELATLHGDGHEERAGDKGESHVKRAVRKSSSVLDIVGNDLALLGGHSAHSSKSGESLDRKLRIGGWAADNERCGEGVDLVEVQGDIERLREGALINRAADEAGVASLNSEDRCSGSEVGLVGDVLSGAQVCGDTDALQDTCSLEEALGGKLAEVVCAGSNGGDIGSLESTGQERDVDGLIVCNLHKVLVEPGSVVTGVVEVFLGEVGHTLAIELSLEMFKSKSVVQDNTVSFVR